MRILSLILIALIALLHAYIAWFEIFAWETRGPNVFTTFPKELFSQTVEMAANQGIYNAFLAAGIFGAATVTMRTFYVQSVPAFLALAFVLLASRADQGER